MWEMLKAVTVAVTGEFNLSCFNSSDVGDVGIKNFSYVEKLKEAVDCKTSSISTNQLKDLY